MLKTLKQLIPSSLLALYHLVWALIGAIRFRFPSRELVVIGVTGTKGKSSVCYLLYSLLQHLGIKTALSSSQYFYIGDERYDNVSRVTMPGRWFLQKFIRQAVNAQAEVVIIEVTSEGLIQHRHRFIDFDIVVCLNLHPEHIEHHGGYANYRQAKGLLFYNFIHSRHKLFRGQLIKKTSVVNLDDAEADYFLSFPAEQKLTFSITEHQPNPTHTQPTKATFTAKGTKFSLEGTNFVLKLWGKENLANVMASLTVLQALGIRPKAVRDYLSNATGLPGRFEVISHSVGFKVVIDYAHTPASIEALYQNLWQLFKPKRLLCLVSAAGGHRDKWKRPVIGELAAKYCQEIVITDEDPFTDDPETIFRAIEAGLKRYLNEHDFHKDYTIIPDRQAAIQKLIQKAERGDIVVLIGKGAEATIETPTGSIPWNERAVVEAALAERRRRYSKISTKTL